MTFLKYSTATASIVAGLAAVRLMLDDLSAWETLLPALGLGMVAVVGLGVLASGRAWGYYLALLQTLGSRWWLQALWLVVLGIVWYGLLLFAPVLTLKLFPFLAILSLLLILLIGLASPSAFAPLAKAYGGVGFGLFFALLLIELFLRVYSFPPSSRVGSQMAVLEAYISDPEIGHALKPNSHFTWTNIHNEFTVDIQINSLGLHDAARQYANPDHLKRVLVLGDSFTEALQVELHQTPTQVAEKCLSEHYQQPIEVINGGLSANGTGQRFRYYLTYGRDFQPDVVVLAMYPSNDLWDNRGVLGEFPTLRGIYSFSVDGDGNLITSYAPPSRSLIDYLADSAHLRSFKVLRAIRFSNRLQAQSRQGFFDTALYSSDFPQPVPTEWAIHQALVREFQKTVEADNAVFALLLIPNWRVVEPDGLEGLPPEVDPASVDFDAMHTAIQADAASANIPLLDLRPLARQHYAEPDPAPLYWQYDGHFNAVGYQLMGESLCQWVIEQGWLEG